jgi:hypothetical protein
MCIVKAVVVESKLLLLPAEVGSAAVQEATRRALAKPVRKPMRSS